MAGIWKSKVVPKITSVFGSGKKKAAAAEAVKSFDESKEEISKEFEEKKTELGPKVIEIYEALPAPIKNLVKKPTDSGLKKNSAAVKKFLEDLAKIEFPGAKTVSEAATKFGTSYVTGPITFVFDKVTSLLPEEPPAPAPEESTSKEVTAEVIEEIKKEEAETAEETPPPPATTETPAPAEPVAEVTEAEAPPPPPPAPTPTPEPEPAQPAEPAPEAAKA